MGLFEEGGLLIEEGALQLREAFEIGERLGDSMVKAQCLTTLAFYLCRTGKFYTAGVAGSDGIGLYPEKGEEYRVCASHCALGKIYRCSGRTEEALHHFEAALGIASSFEWHNELLLLHGELAQLRGNQGRFDEAQTHTEHAKSHMVNNMLQLAYVMATQGLVWCKQRRLEEAQSLVLRAADVYEMFEDAGSVKECKKLLQYIQEQSDAAVASDQSDFM